MFKKIILTLFLISIQFCFSQEKFITKNGFISFFSHTLVEDIKADNNQVLSILDKKNKEISIQLLIRSFNFKKSLMKEHFNESYIESHIYPKATFKGKIGELDNESDTAFKTEIKGILTVRGIEKEVSTIATVHLRKKEITLTGNFTVEVADFDIKIPAIVKNNIAKVIKISFDLKHKPYK